MKRSFTGGSMPSIEEISTDARSADGFVVLYRHNLKHTGFYAITAAEPTAYHLRKLRRVISAHIVLSTQLKGFEVAPRSEGRVTPANKYELWFVVKSGADEKHIRLFLEYARQCHVLTDPIISDLRSRTLRTK